MNRMEQFFETILLAMKIDPDSAYEFGQVDLLDRYSDILSGDNLDYDFDYFEWIYYHPTRAHLEKLELRFSLIVQRWDMLGTNREYRNMNLTDSIKEAIQNIQFGIEIVKEYFDLPKSEKANSCLIQSLYYIVSSLKDGAHPSGQERIEKWLINRDLKFTTGNPITARHISSNVSRHCKTLEDMDSFFGKLSMKKSLKQDGNTNTLLRLIKHNGQDELFDFVSKNLYNDCE